MSPEVLDLNEGVVLGLVATEAPELRVERQRVRGLEVVTQLLLFGSSIGAFSGLWKVVELLVRRYANCVVRIKATRSDGSTIEIEHRELLRKEAEDWWRAFDLSTDRPVQVVVTQPGKT